MLIALTFLGTGDYQETTYFRHDDNDRSQPIRTNLFPIAVVELYKPDKIVAFTTERVVKTKQDDLKKLEDIYGGKFTTQNIPNGNSPAELWAIFNNCTNVFKEDNSEIEILLDITHAFRSIPLLIFIVAAYLRQVKNIKLKHIIYGAFEARNSETNETPIFDLTPFVELLDWMNAVNVFQNYGDVRPIASLNVNPGMKKALNSLSDALLTNRTLEAQEAAMKFNGLPFDESQQPPFRMLVDQLKQNYQQMAVNNPANNRKNSLKAQFEQIKWYMDNQHYLQAITLIREWLISWKCIQQNNRGHWLSSRDRESAENAFNKDVKNKDSQLAQQLMQQIAVDDTAIALWNQCVGIRNDLAHCGMRNNPTEAEQAINKIKELFSTFEDFVETKSDL